MYATMDGGNPYFVSRGLELELQTYSESNLYEFQEKYFDGNYQEVY
jgi:hypothetical protein